MATKGNTVQWLLTHFAAFALTQFASETQINQMRQTLMQQRYLHMAQHLVDKGMLQQQSGLSLGNTALAHVEQSLLVEFTDGRSVVTLHVVGINFKHRLRKGTCPGRSTKVCIRLLRSCLLRSRCHIHLTGKRPRLSPFSTYL